LRLYHGDQTQGTLYIGVTSDLARRVWEHKTSAFDSFTRKYRIRLLVYAESHETMDQAIVREKQLLSVTTRNGGISTTQA
jgi:putative endonuclease